MCIHIYIYMFNVQVRDENGRAVSGMYEWTALTRSQILLVLQKLPDKLCDLVAEDDAVQIGDIWISSISEKQIEQFANQ